MPYRTVRALAPVDAAYMAGLIYGEGTVTLSRRHRNDQRQLVFAESPGSSIYAGFRAECEGRRLHQIRRPTAWSAF
jgi:hypothetical protein